MGNDKWAKLGAPYIEGHYRTVRGRVRAKVIDDQLSWHLPEPPARLVDVGGGGGQQAIPLARRGYEVSLLDPSPSMLERAAAALAEEPPAVRARVELVEGAGERAAELLGGGFDGVLCHAVLMYLEEPEPLVASLAGLAAPGAIVSVVTKNARTMAARPASEGRWGDALAAFDATKEVNGLGALTRGDRLEDLQELLGSAGIELVAWYGVRLFTDGWVPIPPAGADEEMITQVELEASRRDPYRQMSRLFHLVGRRG